MEPSIQNVGLRFVFAGLTATVFLGFLIFASAEPTAMASPALGGIPLSLILAFAIIAFCIAITGTYVVIANRAAR